MAKNNQSESSFREIDSLLRDQAAGADLTAASDVCCYAACMARVENVVAVVSDLAAGTSRIFNGGFARVLGLDDRYCREESIWEKQILSLMPEQEREEKFIAELRFFHYLRRRSPRSRRNYYLVSRLRFRDRRGEAVEVLHRMYYLYDGDSEAVRFAICLYGPLPLGFRGKSMAVNSLTGAAEELTSSDDSDMLSARERQVLALIDSGMKSREIAERLSISVHTVSRHRQEILGRLQVKNSIEACRLARSMGLI